jgi:protocatechuate 3,4-dioxygenase beta subunit
LLIGSRLPALADGVETLNKPANPSLPAPGTGIVAAGDGLAVPGIEPDAIRVTIPAGLNVRQALLYWERVLPAGPGDAGVPSEDSLTVNGLHAANGTLIGEASGATPDVRHASYRADVTHLQVIAAGANVVTLAAPGPDARRTGAGLLVITDDGNGSAELHLRDGNDFAHADVAGMMPQTFRIAPAAGARSAKLALFFSGVGRTEEGGAIRPTVVEMTMNGSTQAFVNALSSQDGDSWDTLVTDLTVPEGVSEITVQAFSRDDASTGRAPAAFNWITAALLVPQPQKERPAPPLERALPTPVAEVPPPAPPLLKGLVGLHGKVVKDANCNGVFDSEFTMVDVPITLRNAAGEIVDAMSTSLVDGTYCFNNRPPGIYTVEVSVPSGFLAFNSVTSLRVEATEPDTEHRTVDFFLCPTTGPTSPQPPPVRPPILDGFIGLHGKVVNDANCNGRFDGEYTMPDVWLILRNEAGEFMDATMTMTKDGTYCFNNRPPGNYSVEVVAPAGFRVFNDTAVARIAALQPTTEYDTLDFFLCSTTPQNPTPPVDPGTGGGTVEICGLVIRDADCNSSQGPGDGTLRNVEVRLYDAALNEVTRTTTGTDGKFCFPNLATGKYALGIVVPTGYRASNGQISMSVDAPDAGRQYGGNDFLMCPLPLLQICGAIVNDTNCDGFFDDTETLLPGVPVVLEDEAGLQVATGTTGPDGTYCLGHANPGRFTVKIQPPPGYTAVQGVVSRVVVAAGVEPRCGNANFFLCPPPPPTGPGKLCGKVFADRNCNGVADAEDPVSRGVLLRLCDADNRPVASTRTDEDGNYCFSAMPLGVYFVKVIPPEGHTVAEQASFLRAEVGQDPVAKCEFLLCGPEPAAICGEVVRDLDCDGTESGSDLELEDIEVTLRTRAGTIVATTRTDADGDYCFRNLTPGRYEVQVAVPAGLSAYRDVTSRAVDATEQGQTQRGINFFLCPPPTVAPVKICGEVVLDFECDGAEDGADIELEGITVRLLDDRGEVLGTAATDDDGDYCFHGLAAGQYRVEVLVPEGLKPFDGVTHLEVAALLPGLSYHDNDFFLCPPPPVKICGEVVLDVDCNGAEDGADLELEGITVRLLSAQGEVLDSATTDTDGDYCFRGWPAGVYAVQVEVPDGLRAFGGAGQLEAQALLPGESYHDNDFFLCPPPPVEICGEVIHDKDCDGYEDDSDLDLEGIEVTLLDASGEIVGSTRTDAGGDYCFTGLPAGRYTMKVTPQGEFFAFRGVTSLVVEATTPGRSYEDRDFFFCCEEKPCVLLAIDEDSIDNGNRPNYFSSGDVNDQLAYIGVRQTLRYFAANVGKRILLHTGQVGDEGWFAIKTIPSSWTSAGPATSGACNYLRAGPGLGTPNRYGDREALLDKIPNVTPLRATGLRLLVGQEVCAVVYDSDISINYGPLNGSLKGANLGVVAFKVLRVMPLSGYSSSTLPAVEIEILSVDDLCARRIRLFQEAPVPYSSSRPFDTGRSSGDDDDDDD